MIFSSVKYEHNSARVVPNHWIDPNLGSPDDSIHCTTVLNLAAHAWIALNKRWTITVVWVFTFSTLSVPNRISMKFKKELVQL